MAPSTRSSSAGAANANGIKFLQHRDGEGKFSADTWAMVDLLHEPRLVEGATPLVARCVREERWTESYARRVLKAYLQWLRLKKVESDWDATKLSPSLVVDRMWHHHILDVKNYYNDCVLLCDHVLHHDPDGGLDPRARKVRLRNTKRALGENFAPETIDAEIWKEALPSVVHISPEDGSDEEEEEKDEEKEDSDPDRQITIKVRDGTEEATFFKIRRSTKVWRVMTCYAERKGVSRYSLRFYIDGEYMSHDTDETFADLEINDGDELDVLLPQCGC